MSNNILEKTTFYGGLNMNPIPLEFSQEISTTKWLLGMDKKLSTIIDKVNNWYDTLLNDIDNNGILYQHIIAHLDSEFISDLEDINTQLSAFQFQINSILESIETINSEMEVLSNVKPLVNVGLSPSQELYNIGESINSVVLTYNITQGSETIDKVEVYKNDILIATIISGITNGVNTYVDGNVINSDTTYKVIVYDKYNTVTSNEKKYSFINNFYYGVVDDTTINETLIKSLTPLKTLKSDLTETFTTDSQKILFAYPQIYGNLTNIIDTDNFDMIEGFTKTIINLTLNSEQVPYNVYLSNNFIYDNNVVLKFEF